MAEEHGAAALHNKRWGATKGYETRDKAPSILRASPCFPPSNDMSVLFALPLEGTAQQSRPAVQARSFRAAQRAVGTWRPRLAALLGSATARRGRLRGNRDWGWDASSSQGEATPAEAGEELPSLLIRLRLQGTLTAKQACVLPHWATAAGALASCEALGHAHMVHRTLPASSPFPPRPRKSETTAPPFPAPCVSRQRKMAVALTLRVRTLAQGSPASAATFVDEFANGRGAEPCTVRLRVAASSNSGAGWPRAAANAPSMCQRSKGPPRGG